VTVWPEGHTDSASAPTLLIRTRATQTIKAREGRETWTVDGLIAYSKICTHVGCPVGLYQADKALLLCPCHQSTFDLANNGVVIFGPANRALPQLPIMADDEGYLVAQSDFTEPVGPSFWERDKTS
jgi:ubiquinol-cytochrome c reductase iron-sulfur subunit